MRILVDNNTSYRVAKFLNESFIGSNHVSKFGLDENTEDIAIWKFAKENEYTILTKDNDYEAMSRLFGCPPKVIQLICGNKSTAEIVQLLTKNLSNISQFNDDSENCLLYLQ